MGYDWLEVYKRKRGNIERKPLDKADKMYELFKDYKLPDAVVSKEFTELRDLIDCVYDDLKGCVSSGKDLCKQSHMFEDGNGPDYSDTHVQQLYLLRYSYAYAFENTEMFKWVLKKRGTPKDLSVVSIGCGCMVDNWALQYAAKSLNMNLQNCKYTGIDLIHWSYQLGTLKNTFLKMNAADYFKTIRNIDSDVYIFPRSIGDICDNDFNCICEAFSSKDIKKKKIYLLVSKRKGNAAVSKIDRNRTAHLKKMMSNQGYICSDMKDESQYKKALCEYFGYYDPYFNYPNAVKKAFPNLKKECAFHGKREQCSSTCLNRMPILTTKWLCYNAFQFERK